MFTPKLEYNKKIGIVANLKAVINWTNFLLQEMTAGRVINSQTDISELKKTNAELEEQLAVQDELSIELFEGQMAQEEINIAQDDALIEIYEMIGGVE